MYYTALFIFVQNTDTDLVPPHTVTKKREAYTENRFVLGFTFREEAVMGFGSTLYGQVTRTIRVPHVEDLIDTIRTLGNDPELADIPYEAGDEGNTIVIPRTALPILRKNREKLGRFRLVRNRH